MNQKAIAWYELPPERWRNNSDQYLENDSQRQKVYDVEYAAGGTIQITLDGNKLFSSLEEIQKFVDKLTASSWFIKRFGQHSIKVENKTGRGAHAQICSSTIRFSKHSRRMMIVLHEVAHIAKKLGAGSHHGRFFARTFLELVEHIIGKEAAKILKGAFKKGRVKYLPKRQLSEETREKLRQGFIDRVLKQKVEV